MKCSFPKEVVLKKKKGKKKRKKKKKKKRNKNKKQTNKQKQNQNISKHKHTNKTLRSLTRKGTKLSRDSLRVVGWVPLLRFSLVCNIFNQH